MGLSGPKSTTEVVTLEAIPAIKTEAQRKVTFRALLVDKTDDENVVASVSELDESSLPADGDVTVAVEYSTLNYKDGLCVNGLGGLVRKFPHVPGVDFAGTVEASSDQRFQPGDKVVLTGWRVGEVWWGGYAEKAKVKADWLVPLPAGLTTMKAMAVGTAGFASMLAVMALEAHGAMPDKGEILVTGAAGGVGSVATAILARLGYNVAAVTGRPEQEDYLRGLGASRIVARGDIDTPSGKPLEKEQWAGCVDAVGGAMLATVLPQMRYGGSVAAVGLAGGNQLETTVIPFLLRGVNLLGIDSVMQPVENRKVAWQRIATDLPIDALLIIFPLVCGTVWMCGSLYLQDVKLNFYNIVALPTIIGMGIDNGVHLYHRYREEGPGSMPLVLRSTGGAMLISMLTTMIGFFGLMTATHPGLNAIGRLAMIGLLTCFVTAVLVLPAILEVLEGKRWRRENGQNAK